MICDGILYLFEKDRVVELAFVDKFCVSIELVAAIAGDGRSMVVDVGYRKLLMAVAGVYYQ
jgi:hypothetical protein